MGMQLKVFVHTSRKVTMRTVVIGVTMFSMITVG